MDTMQGFRALATGRIHNAIAIYCTECIAHMSIASVDVPDVTPEQVVDFWNRRAPGAAKPDGNAPGPAPIGWRYRETQYDAQTRKDGNDPDSFGWFVEWQAERPYCAWTHHVMEPLYATPTVSDRAEGAEALADAQIDDLLKLFWEEQMLLFAGVDEIRTREKTPYLADLLNKKVREALDAREVPEIAK